MARFRFTGRFPSSNRRKLSVNRFLRENIKTGLEGPDKAKYQLRGGPNQSIEVGQTAVSNSFAVTTGVDNALTGIAASVTGGGGQRPNQVLSNVYCPSQSINCWMNASAFTSPTAGSYGNLGLNSLIGPGYFDVDVALSRRFAVRERQSLEVRAESFNIANRVNFLNPTSTLNSSNFGKIQTDISPRIMQFAVKYVF